MSKSKKTILYFLQIILLLLSSSLILYPIYFLLTLIFPSVFTSILDSELTYLDCDDTILHKLSFLSCFHFICGLTMAYGINFGIREFKSSFKDLKLLRSSPDDYIKLQKDGQAHNR